MTRIWPLALASTALLFSTQSFSADTVHACNTYADGYTQNAETYFHLDTGRALNDEPVERVFELAELLGGKWRGQSSAVNCTGHYSNSTAETAHYKIDAEVIHKYNGALKLEAEKSDKRSVKLTRLYLAPELKRRNAPKWRNYSIEFLSPTSIKFDHKYRVRNGDPRDPIFEDVIRFPYRATCVDALYAGSDTPCDNKVNSSRLIHEIKVINLLDDQLTVDHQLFMNGLFVSSERWMLVRS